MLSNLLRKNKIDLGDYNYKRDLTLRVQMSRLNCKEISVLREITDGSLVTTLMHLSEGLGIFIEELESIVNKLQTLKLFNIENNAVVLDKEIRKCFEVELLKFDDFFEPGMEYLLCLLNKVPIHVIPTWYSISRTSDHIFLSVIEKYLLHPRSYERYLNELQAEDERVACVLKLLYSSSNYSLPTERVKEALKLNDEKFHEFILLLEFHFVCCVIYIKNEDSWEECLTLFGEWKEYLLFKEKNEIISIANDMGVVTDFCDDFCFVQELTNLIKISLKKPLKVIFDANSNLYEVLDGSKLFQKVLPEKRRKYISQLITTALKTGLASIDDSIFVSNKYAIEWHKVSLQEKTISLYRMLIGCISMDGSFFCERDIREIERGLKKIANHNWVVFDDFMQNFTGTIGRVEPISLRKKGKKWRYALPSYQEEEIEFIRDVVFSIFFQSAITNIGTYEGKECFRITPLGRMSLQN